MNKLLISESPLLVLPSLANAIGINEAIILQQIHFWISKEMHEKDGRYWVYNSYDDWSKQFPFWSRSTIIRILNRLEDNGLIITGNYNSMKIDRTKWYTIDYDVVGELLNAESTM